MTQIMVNLPYEDRKQFAMLAAKNDVTMSQLIRWFIRDLICNENRSITFHIEK